jgi:hypothetical protein
MSFNGDFKELLIEPNVILDKKIIRFFEFCIKVGRDISRMSFYWRKYWLKMSD